MPKIFFIGMPGSGKSHLGRKVSAKLELPFFDLDEQIVAVTGQPIKEIFSEHGEDHFRKLEAEQLRKIALENENFLMATGGGTPCFHENMTFINQQGISLFINISLEVIATNMSEKGMDKRPLFKNFTKENILDELKEKFRKRSVFYDQAHIVVNLEKRNYKRVKNTLMNYLKSHT